jgi:HD-GYP domain-containing protein (c-di-GMP phosphodiesterase class II)
METWWVTAEIYHEIIECLITALEAKDPYTKGHSTRVADMAHQLGELAGLQGDALEDLHLAAHLHDIGKIGIPDRVLNKSGPLSAEEQAIIQKHPVIGYQILARSSRLKYLATIVLHHHERWDGRGYPAGLRGGEIPLSSRIIAICDAIDAMTSARPYREPLTPVECLREIWRNRGKQFDPELLKLMEKSGFSVFGAGKIQSAGDDTKLNKGSTAC